MFMRGTKFQLRTAFSAGLLPPLRQTASYLLASRFSFPNTVHRVFLKNIVGTDKRNVFCYGLGNDNSVEWVAMNKFQS
jgi:hypothetical protein